MHEYEHQQMHAGPCLPLRVVDLGLHTAQALVVATMQVHLQHLLCLRPRSQLPHQSPGSHVRGRSLHRGVPLPQRHPVVPNLKLLGRYPNPDLDEEQR